MKIAIKVISTIVFVVFMLLAFLIAFSLLPLKGNIKVMSVMSGSMEPSIKTGELIFVKPFENYQVGDIITFKESNNNIDTRTSTHRIFEVIDSADSPLFQTKGDANDVPDENKINKNQIIGKYIFGIPYLGYIVSYIKTLPGLILIIIIPATIIVYEEAKKIRNEISEMKKKKAIKKVSKAPKEKKEKNG